MPQRNPLQEINFFLRSYLTPAVRWLFVANIVVFLCQATLFRIPPLSALLGVDGGSIIPYNLACRPDMVSHGAVWQLVTYAFLHAEPFHLFGNMLILWFLGPLVERRVGTIRFYRVYFAAAILAGVVHTAFFNRPVSPVWPYPPIMVGASGAVMAVAVMCAYYYFDLMVLFMFVFPIKLGWLIIILVSIEALYMVLPGGASGGVAHHAHLVGAAVGFVYVKGKWGWFDLVRFYWHVTLSRLFPWRRRRRRPRPSREERGRVRDVFRDDDYFRR